MRAFLFAPIAALLIALALTNGPSGPTKPATQGTATLQGLDRTRVRAREALLNARTPAQQRTQAQRLAGAYRIAARALDDDALARAADAYTRLAASVDSASAFRTASAAAVDAERALTTAKLHRPAPANRGGSLLPALLAALAALSVALAVPRRRRIVVAIPEDRRLPPAPVDFSPTGLPAWDSPPWGA